MKLTIINVGYGDAMLVELKEGYTALIDGGSKLTSEFSGYPFRIPAAEYLKKLNITHLNAVFITHIHEDHVCGLMPVMNAVQVDQLYVPYPVEPFLCARALTPEATAPRSVSLYTAALNDFVAILLMAKEKGTRITSLSPSDRLEPASDLSIHALAPKADAVKAYMHSLQAAWHSDDAWQVTQLLALLDRASNETSLVLKLETEGVAVLAAADNTPDHWDKIPLSLLQNVNVLKLPHHGQKDAVNASIMREMPLQYVITTASSDRRYNSANAAVYEQLEVLFPKGKQPRFLFSDERSYSPWFSQPEGFQAITLEMDSGRINPEFIKIN